MAMIRLQMAFLEEQLVVSILALLLACFLAILVTRTTSIPEPECTAYNLKVQNSFQNPIREVQYQDCSGAVKSLRLNPGEVVHITLRASDDILRTGFLTLLSDKTGSVVITNVEFLGERRNVSFSEPECGRAYIGDQGIELVFTVMVPTGMCTFRLTSVR